MNTLFDIGALIQIATNNSVTYTERVYACCILESLVHMGLVTDNRLIENVRRLRFMINMLQMGDQRPKTGIYLIRILTGHQTGLTVLGATQDWQETFITMTHEAEELLSACLFIEIHVDNAAQMATLLNDWTDWCLGRLKQFRIQTHDDSMPYLNMTDRDLWAFHQQVDSAIRKDGIDAILYTSAMMTQQGSAKSQRPTMPMMPQPPQMPINPQPPYGMPGMPTNPQHLQQPQMPQYGNGYQQPQQVNPQQPVYPSPLNPQQPLTYPNGFSAPTPNAVPYNPPIQPQQGYNYNPYPQQTDTDLNGNLPYGSANPFR